MRQVGLALLLSGCVLGEQQWSSFDGEAFEASSMDSHFRELAGADNYGHGVVPTATGTSAWLGMGDTRVCSFQGSTGTPVVDVYFDDEIVVLDADIDTFLVAVDGAVVVTGSAGQVEAQYDVNGEVLAGEMTEEGLVLLVATDDGCMIVLIREDGTQLETAVPDETCDNDTDIAHSVTGEIYIGGPEIVQLTPQGVTPVAEGSEVAFDDVSGVLFTGERGKDQLLAHTADGVKPVELSAGLVDFSIGGGRLVALLEDDTLVELRPSTGEVVASAPYTGLDFVSNVQMSAGGTGLVLHGSSAVQFYRLQEGTSAKPSLEADDPTRNAQDQ